MVRESSVERWKKTFLIKNFNPLWELDHTFRFFFLIYGMVIYELNKLRAGCLLLSINRYSLCLSFSIWLIVCFFFAWKNFLTVEPQLLT